MKINFETKQKEFISYVRKIKNDANMIHKSNFLFENAFKLLELDNKEFNYFLNFIDEEYVVLYIYFQNCVTSFYSKNDQIESFIHFHPSQIKFNFDLNNKNYLFLSIMFISNTVLNFEFKDSNVDYGMDFLKYILNKS